MVCAASRGHDTSDRIQCKMVADPKQKHKSKGRNMKFNVREFKEKMINRDMSRREFTAGLAVVGLTTLTAPMMASPAKAAGDVNYFTWSGYDDEGFFSHYMEKYGGMPDTSFFGAEAEALAKVRSGFKPTVGHPCVDTVGRWDRSGIVKPIDTSRLSNYGDIWDGLKNMPGDSNAAGEKVFVPFDWGNSSIIVRTDLVDAADLEDPSWNILFDEKYAGRVAMYNSTSAFAVAGLVLGIPVERIWNPTDEDIAAMKGVLAKQNPNVRFYWDAQSDAEQAIASGEVVASYAWNEAKVHLQDQGIPVEYLNPKEGILCWVCGLAMFNDEYGAGDEDAAYDMIDSMLAQDSGEYMINEWGYGHSNQNAFNETTAAALDNLGLASPADLFAQGVFFQDIPDESNAKMEEAFSEVMAGF